MVLVCPTCERPDSLERSLRSYAENAVAFAECPRVVVGDNSRSPATQIANRRIVDALHERFGVTGAYLGADEKTRLAHLLKGRGFDADVVQFALFDSSGSGLTYVGANYNALLLHTAGSHVVSVDDDTICRMTQLAEPDEQHSESGDTERWSSCWPAELYSCVNIEAAAAHLRPLDASHLHVHQMAFESHPHVRVTVPGVVGDCGWASPSFYLLLTGSSLSRLVATEHQYRRACLQRTVVRAVRHATLTRENYNMQCMFFGVDNRTPPPPFLPIGRGCDHLFGMTVSALCPGDRFAHLPVLLEHTPAERRRFWPGEIMRSASGTDVGFVMGTLTSRWATTAGEGGKPAERMDALGEYLLALSQQPIAQFKRDVLAAVTASLSELVSAIRARRAAHQDHSPWWAVDSDRFASLIETSMTRPDFVNPLDLQIGRTGPDALEVLRRLVVLFGRLLRSWPGMWSATRDAIADGDVRWISPMRVDRRSNVTQ